jgi:hypothetical protein
MAQGASSTTVIRDYIPGMPRTNCFVLYLLLCFAAPLHAQTDRWQVALDGDKYVWDIQLVRLDGDSLVVKQSDSLVGVPVEHINEIRLIKKVEVDLGAGAAGAMNALTGGGDEIYDLSALDLPERLRKVQKILEVHPVGP